MLQVRIAGTFVASLEEPIRRDLQSETPLNRFDR
jgi:hypothetical protein